MAKAETTVRALLDQADVQVNGSRPWDIQVHDARLYDRILSRRFGLNKLARPA